MEPIIIKTRTEEADRLAFYKNASAKGFLTNLIVACVGAALFIGYGVYTYVKYGFVDSIVIFIVALLLYFLVNLLFVPSRQKKAAKLAAEREGVDENTLTFYEDCFVDDYVNKLSSGHTEHSYASLDKVSETAEHIYVYIDKTRAFIIRREDVTDGQLEKLRELLRGKLPENKYEIKKMGK